MVMSTPAGNKMVMDLEKMGKLNAEGCPACGRKFEMGETVVAACGAWEGGPKYIHETEAVWNDENKQYVEKKCYQADRATGAR